MDSQSTSNSWIGRSIGDRQRYRLDKRLGGGGMGDVFLAMDTRLGQLVALKLLKDTLVSSKEARKRFEREVEVCAALQSDNIVKVTDCGVTSEGFPFYVMEYLRGETLRQLLVRSNRLTVEHAVSIVTQVGKGLQLAHKGVTLWRNEATSSEHIQVVHRDLKPDNIFLVSTDSEELVKIVDFGIAKIRNESSEQTNLTSAFLGTLRYAAPEQLKGEMNLDGRADIYSLGIILYEMLSGADPFGFSIKTRSHSEASWIFAHTTAPPTPLRSQPGCNNLSPQLEAVVMQCLQKEPDRRFATVEELNQALQAAASSIVGGDREEIIAQPLQQTESSNEETITRLLNFSFENKHEQTIAQKPTPIVGHPEQTIAQQQPFPPQKSLLEETNIQISKKSQVTLRLPINVRLLLGVVGFVALGGMLYTYFQVLSAKDLEGIKALQIKGNYQECIAKSEQVTYLSTSYHNAQQYLNDCRWEYAKTLAKDNKLNEAIAEAEKIPENSPRYPEAQKNISEWDRGI